MINIKKTSTVGLLGQKGTGKTYLTRQIAEAIPKDVVLFDTIGVVKPKGTRVYEVDIKDPDKQAVLFSMITQKTHRNIGVDLSRLLKDEIVYFTETYLKITPMKNKYIIIDEMADYTPQIGERTKELERLVRHGRNFGNTFIFNTQRPAYITKNVLNLIDVVVFFRLVWSRDIEVVKDVLNNLGKKNITSEINDITNFGVGECKVYKFGVNTKEEKAQKERHREYSAHMNSKGY
jgi:ABC-type dipeptide/oligopeptide/nickel transport system ATPase component